MSSPIGELPVRRHLLPEVAALLLQAAVGARQRALRRQALLGEHRPQEVPYLPEQIATNRQALPRDPVRPGGAGQVKEPGLAGATAPDVNTPPATPVAVPHATPLQAGSGRGAAALPPPIIRLMQAAALRVERARALEQEALQSAIMLPVRRGVLAPVSTQQAVHAPLSQATDGAAIGGQGSRVGSTSYGAAVPLPTLSGPRNARPADTVPPVAPAPSSAWPSPAATAYGAPFGPHPAPPGPGVRPLAPESPPGPRLGALASPTPGWGSPALPGAAYPESELLQDERLRTALARILRADALRHGLDLKER